MMFLKPKDLAQKLNVPPDKVSAFASDIDEAGLYTFHRTPLGSFLFQEQDVQILKEYQELLRFFQRKSEALQILDQEMQYLFGERDTERFAWTRHLYNAKYLP